MKKTFRFVSGDKGGVGKSEVAEKKATLSNADASRKTYLIDTDTRNPDLFQVFSKRGIKVELFDIAVEDGFMEMVNFLDTTEEGSETIIDLPAGGHRYFEKHKELFAETLELMGAELIIDFVMDVEVNSVVALKQFMESFGDVPDKVNVLINLGKGDREDFFEFDESKLKKELEKNKKVTITEFPRLNLRQKKKMREHTEQRKPNVVEVAQDSSYPIIDRQQLSRYVRELRAAFSE